MSSNLKIAKLHNVSVDSGKAAQSNKYYYMFEQTDGTFKVEYGRINKTKAEETYPMSEWDKIYNKKTKRKKDAYTDVTHLFVETTTPTASGKVTAIADNVVKKLMDELQGYANKTIKQNYTVSTEAVTEAMVNEAQTIIDDISKLVKMGQKADVLNPKLMKLYMVIPRFMDNVKKHLFIDITSKQVLVEAQQRLGDEQSKLDVMAGQVALNKNQKAQGTKGSNMSLLDLMGLKIVAVTNSKEIQTIKTLMGGDSKLFKQAYEVINTKTQTRYDSHLKKTSTNKTDLLFHGSRNENWFNILETGLMIRPSGAVHTGSMFDDGIYFASKAQKSIGYTSYSGAVWTGGRSDKGYLSLFNVHVGKQLHIHQHDSSCYTISKKVKAEGYDSVYAHAGQSLRNEEFIVYNMAQCTVKYLIEFGN